MLHQYMYLYMYHHFSRLLFSFPVVVVECSKNIRIYLRTGPTTPPTPSNYVSILITNFILARNFHMNSYIFSLYNILYTTICIFFIATSISCKVLLFYTSTSLQTLHFPCLEKYGNNNFLLFSNSISIVNLLCIF